MISQNNLSKNPLKLTLLRKLVKIQFLKVQKCLFRNLTVRSPCKCAQKTAAVNRIWFAKVSLNLPQTMLVQNCLGYSPKGIFLQQNNFPFDQNNQSLSKIYKILRESRKALNSYIYFLFLQSSTKMAARTVFFLVFSAFFCFLHFSLLRLGYESIVVVKSAEEPQ